MNKVLMNKVSHIIFTGVILLTVQTNIFACGGSAVGSVGNSTIASLGPTAEARVGTSLLAGVSDAVIEAILFILSTPIVPMDPITGTIASTVLDPKNAASINDAVEGQVREGKTGSRNAPAALGDFMRDLEARERSGNH